MQRQTMISRVQCSHIATSSSESNPHSSSTRTASHSMLVTASYSRPALSSRVSGLSVAVGHVHLREPCHICVGVSATCDCHVLLIANKAPPPPPPPPPPHCPRRWRRPLRAPRRSGAPKSRLLYFFSYSCPCHQCSHSKQRGPVSQRNSPRGCRFGCRKQKGPSRGGKGQAKTEGGSKPNPSLRYQSDITRISLGCHSDITRMSLGYLGYHTDITRIHLGHPRGKVPRLRAEISSTPPPREPLRGEGAKGIRAPPYTRHHPPDPLGVPTEVTERPQLLFELY